MPQDLSHHFKFLGVKVRDKVSGFEGTVASLCFDLYGCVQAGVFPPVNKDGHAQEGHYYDIKRLIIIDQTPVMEVPTFAEATEIGGVEFRPAIR